jgi:hypothetical protein
MRNLLLCMALAFLSASCVHERQPEIYYFCEATLTNEYGAFRANPNEVEWQYDLGDGARAILNLPHAWQSAASFRAQGFNTQVDAPGMVISFDRRFNRNDWMQQPPSLIVAAQLSVGDRVQTQWVSNLHMTVFRYSAWNDLLTAEGDMSVTLYEPESRAVLQRATIPRGALESVEATLQRLSTEMVEMEREPQRRCTPLELEEDIIVT